MHMQCNINLHVMRKHQTRARQNDIKIIKRKTIESYHIILLLFYCYHQIRPVVFIIRNNIVSTANDFIISLCVRIRCIQIAV